ncbi:hypothetical protein HK096_006592, partial [Nowakowskiella sp. JEL0078]
MKDLTSDRPPWNLNNYTNFQTLHLNTYNQSGIFRAHCANDPSKTVILKGNLSPSEDDNAKLRIEFETLNLIHKYKFFELANPNKANFLARTNSELYVHDKGIDNSFPDVSSETSIKSILGEDIKKRIVIPLDFIICDNCSIIVLEDHHGYSIQKFRLLQSEEEKSSISLVPSADRLEIGIPDSVNVFDKIFVIEDVLHIAVQIAEALYLIHSAGITHNDINPDNITMHVNEEGLITVQLIDFNLADLGHGDIESQSYLRGTLAYMSPG